MTRFFRNNIILLLMVFIIGVISSSCRDDLLYDNSIIGDGESNVSVELSFTPMGSALNTRSDGQAVKDIKNLCVVIYKSNGEFYDKFMANELTGYKCDPSGNTQYPADTLDYKNGVQNTNFDYIKNPKTPKANFDVKLPYGKYRMYAVANMGMLPDDITENEETLKSHRVSWNPEITSATGVDDEGYNGDHAMFGYFTPANNTSSTGFNAPELVINKPDISLHCWIKRVVSKVTIAFDPSGLKEAVSVYIRSVRIYDIPKECSIGKKNEPKSKDDLIHEGEIIYYEDGKSNSTDYESWLRLQKGSGIKGADKHLETDDALYFFENMQGDYEGQKLFCKVQDPDSVGTSINEPITDKDGAIKNDFKDRVPYGSYIEVEGYYVSHNKQKLTKGPIKYRFMLGKNTTYNYNAERNFHYKLTLKFRGWANEADWHIVYDEITPTVFVPDPYYISYLYGQSMTLPVRITGVSQLQQYKLHAQIIENNWVPSILKEKNKTELAPEISGAYDLFEGIAWNKHAYEQFYGGKTEHPANYVGFLSLRYNSATVVGNSNDQQGPDANDFLYQYYIGNKGVSPRYFADYEFDQPGTFGINRSGDNGTYTVGEIEDNSVTIELPMYTRPKQLVPKTDFTGNNTFYAYVRKAKVRFSLRPKNAPDPTEDNYSESYDIEFTIKHADGSEEEVKHVDINIYQVPRIVNPTAIWRKHDSQEEFQIKLMQLKDVAGSEFDTFESDGPWRASIYTDPDHLIKLTGNGQEVTTTGKYIEGESGTAIDFKYEPNGTCGENDARCGIILVEYHNYTCHHLIFVRQGYDKGMQLGGQSWSCYNAYAAGRVAGDTGSNNNTDPDDRTSASVLVTESPLSIGSLFKRGQYNYAILESNNKAHGWLKSITNEKLSTAYVNGEKCVPRESKWGAFGGWAWKNYSGQESRFNKKWADTWTAVNKGNVKLAVPTFDDYKNLSNATEHAYGVVYGDGATGVATKNADAFGYTDYDNKGTGSAMGMRACIVYNDDNGDQIMFPLGALGQGRRACVTIANKYNSNYNGTQLPTFPFPGYGSLTYSRIRGLLYSSSNNLNNYRPLTYNIYRQPGAIYWFKQPGYKKEDGTTSMSDNWVAGWDINYYNLVFNPHDESTVGSGINGAINGELKDEDGKVMKDEDGNDIKNGSYYKSSDALPIKFIYKNN